MTTLNVTVGLIAGLIALLPLLFVKRNSIKLLVAMIAVGVALLGNVFSQQYIYPQYLLYRFEKGLAQQPVFILIAKNHPEEYKKYLSDIKKEFHNKEDINAVSQTTSALLNRIFNQHLEKAPNDPIDLYLKSTIELYRYLHTKMPELVVMVEIGKQSSNVDLSKLSEDLTFETLLGHLLDSKKLIIQDSIKSPVNTINAEAANASLEKIHNNLSQKFGEEIIKNVFIPSQVTVPPRVSSLVILEFYSEILATGKENAGEIMRFIGSKNAQSQKKK